MNASFERAMNGPARWFVSLLGVGAAFALGRFVAGAIRERREDDNEEVILQIPAAQQIKIDAELKEVYSTARRLEYFNQFLFGVDHIELIDLAAAKLKVSANGKDYEIDLQIIADQENEFFALRVEHEGVLYGTCLLRFESDPHGGTQVSTVTRYKVQLPTPLMNDVKAVVAREVDVYLQHLKTMCEQDPVVPMPQ